MEHMDLAILQQVMMKMGDQIAPTIDTYMVPNVHCEVMIAPKLRNSVELY